MIEITVALIGTAGTFLGVWYQNRKTRAAVKPVSNGFAASVQSKLDSIQADVTKANERIEKVDGKVETIDDRLDRHIEAHANGTVVPMRRRRAG